MKYYYRFDVDCRLGELFRSFWHNCDLAEAAAERYCAKVRAKAYYSSPDHFAGGVSCVVFDNPEEVNREIWKEADEKVNGETAWLPNCERRVGAIIIPHRGFYPSNTASRIYQKRYSRWNEVRNLYTSEEWAEMGGVPKGETLEETQQLVDAALKDEIFCQYVELYSTAASKYPNRKLPWSARTAIHLESDRMGLKVVGIGELCQIMQADVTAVKEKVTETPTFFEWCNRYYIGMPYPCCHPALEQITEEYYKMKQIDLTSYERERQKLEMN